MKTSKLPPIAIAAALVALFLAIYVLILLGPIKSQTTELEARKNALENEKVTTEPYVIQKRGWEEELEIIKSNGDAISIPDYDNINNIINEMHVILGDVENFSLNYGTIVVEDNIVTRELELSFRVKNYDLLKKKIQAINESNYKYQITDISVSSEADNSNSCKLTIVAYEYNETNEI